MHVGVGDESPDQANLREAACQMRPVAGPVTQQRGVERLQAGESAAAETAMAVEALDLKQGRKR